MLRAGRIVAAVVLVGLLAASALAAERGRPMRMIVTAQAGPCGNAGNVLFRGGEDGVVTVYGPLDTGVLHISVPSDLFSGWADIDGRIQAFTVAADADTPEAGHGGKVGTITVQGPNGKPMTVTIPDLPGWNSELLSDQFPGLLNFRVYGVPGMGPGKKEKVAYLGVTTSPIGPELGKHLKLPRGVGLMVDHVDPKGPAAEAGIAKGDVLYKLDDQLLINMPQLAVLVRMNNPGDEVKLTVIQSGDRKTKTVKLIEKEMFIAAGGSPGFDIRRLEPMPVPRATPPKAGSGQTDGAQPRQHPSVAVTMAMTDGVHRIVVKPEDDGMRLTVKDKDGKILFDKVVPADEAGGIDADKIKGLPDDIKAKIRKMVKALRSSRIQIREQREEPRP